MRGILLVNSLKNLQTWGVYDRYRELAPEAVRQTIESAIASSWIDIGTALAHYDTAERLGVCDLDVEIAGEHLAARIAETFLGTAVRASRRAGLEAIAFVLSNNDRLWDRMYMGGGCRVLQYGPKELVLEDRGNPLFAYRLFRLGYNAYMKSLTGIFCKMAVVQPEPNGGFHGSESYATRFSWV